MSSIEWTEKTWNPVTGCTKVSPGCAHCYAETFAERFRGVPGHPFEQGFDLKLWPERLPKPFTWKKPRKVFVNSMSDLFHESVPFDFIDRVFAVMALTPQHTYQVLTKRPERMREYMLSWWKPQPDSGAMRLVETISRVIVGRPRSTVIPLVDEAMGKLNQWPLPNVWLGTSVENQRWADVRIPELLATPAAVRFLSCEPLLGPLDLGRYLRESGVDWPWNKFVDWVIVGGESGPGARPFDLAWARSIVSQCQAAGVAVFVKQLGAKPYSEKAEQIEHENNEGYGVTLGREGGVRLKSRKGGAPDEWPEDLRVREFPR